MIEKTIEEAIEPIKAGCKRKPYTILQRGLRGNRDVVLLLSCEDAKEAREAVKDLNYAFKPKRYYYHKTKVSRELLMQQNKLIKGDEND